MKSFGIKRYYDLFYRSALALLILLWAYSGISKLLEFEETRLQMLNQVIPTAISRFILWSVSVIEVLTAFLLTVRITRFAGIVLSVILMGIFTLYIGAVVLGFFRYSPCSCGGIITKLSWTQHLIFNTCFLALAIYSLFINLKERRAEKIK